MHTTDLEHFEVCIIGAGVVGLAIAAEVAKQGKTVLIIEDSDNVGSGISSRNSEVIHAGIYYPTNSLKAKLCVEGKNLLYDFCEKHNVGHSRVGKLIVASNNNQADYLNELFAKAKSNGVEDLRYIETKELNSLEPNVHGTGALLSPSTGIIDSHALMLALASSVESNGGIIAFRTHFIEAEQNPDSYKVSVECDGERYQFRSSFLINSTGLKATDVAKKIEGIPESDIPNTYLCKGNYFSLTGQPPFSHLIYPVPDKNFSGLGIHATIDLAGQVKFGPDTDYIDTENYDVNNNLREKFANAIKLYYPHLSEEKLVPAYSGIRPKIQAKGTPPKDFLFSMNERSVNLFGIESPGLTSCLSIGRLVSDYIYDY